MTHSKYSHKSFGKLGFGDTPKYEKTPPKKRPQNYPIGSMYGIFTYIYHKNQPDVGKYTIPYMDPMGIVPLKVLNFFAVGT